jgi:hypothetical protein
MSRASELRKLAGWYREFAERAANPIIWESRLLTAEDLLIEAERLERQSASSTVRIKPGVLSIADAED